MNQLSFLSWVPTAEFWALMGLIATGVGHWFWQVSKDRNARLMAAQVAAAAAKEKEDERLMRLQEREEDRKDLIAAAEAAAKLNIETMKPVIDQLQLVDKNGHSRLKSLLSSNVTTRGIVKEYAKKADLAIETSNGIKKDLLENGVKLIADTVIKTEVVNDQEHPVNTQQV